MGGSLTILLDTIKKGEAWSWGKVDWGWLGLVGPPNMSQKVCWYCSSAEGVLLQNGYNYYHYICDNPIMIADKDGCQCVLKAKREKCEKEILCDTCGCCMAWLGYSEDQKTCLDCNNLRRLAKN